MLKNVTRFSLRKICITTVGDSIQLEIVIGSTATFVLNEHTHEY